MALLSISSTNPNFSHILMKNPATIKESGKPFERSLRKGRVYGWYAKNNQQFLFLFKDSNTEVSFSDKPEFEYLDTTRYSHPFIYNQIVTEFARNALNGVEEYDTPEYFSSVHATMRIKESLVNKLGGVGAFREIFPGYYEVSVTNNTVKKTLNAFVLITILAAISNDDLFIPMNYDVIVRYLKMLNEVNAEYNLRHLFVSRVINNDSVFQKALDDGILNTDSYTFKYGNTQVQRYRAIRNQLEDNRGKTLIDIGCGEFYHGIRLAPLYKEVFAYDKDEYTCENLKGKLKGKDVNNVEVICAEVDEYKVTDLPAENADILLIEVIEHMPREEAVSLVAALFKTSFNKIVITTPCADFNKFYGMIEGDMRHPDHVWELTRSDFKDLLAEAVFASKNTNLSISYEDVGDIVKVSEVAVPSTQMAVITVNQKQPSETKE